MAIDAGPRARRFSTLPLTEHDRVPQWEAWNRHALVGLRCHTADGRGLRGEEINLELPDVRIARVRAQPHRAVRDGTLVADTPNDAVVAYAVLRGRSSFAGRAGTHRLAAGEAVVVDGDLPFERCLSTAFTELVLAVPRSIYTDRFATSRHSPAGQTKMSGLTAARAGALARHLGRAAEATVHPDETAAVRTVALDLVGDLSGRENVGDRLALAYLLVEQHLADPSLSEPVLAQWLGLSPRHLSRLFADAGTSVPAFVAERRVARAAVLLRAPERRSVAEIAAACGFSSATYFNRVFVRHHGRTPGVFRAG